MSKWGKWVLVVLGIFMLGTAIASCSASSTTKSKIATPTVPSQIKKSVNQTNVVNRLNITLADITVKKTRVKIGIAVKNQSSHVLDFFPEQEGSIVINGIKISADPSETQGDISGTFQPGTEKSGELVFLVPTGKTLSPEKIAQVQVHLGDVSDETFREISPADATLVINKVLLAKQLKAIKKLANIEYTVKSGDSLYAISLKYNTTVDELEKLNGIDKKSEGRLSIGRVLKIPTKIELSDKEITRGPTSAKKIALTFDVGSESGATPQILKALADANVNATFFLTGEWAEKNPELARSIAGGGNLIGNRTDTHPNLTKLTNSEIVKELESAENKIRKETGVSSKPLFRAPYGARDQRVLKVAASAGYRSVHWTVDSLDLSPSMTANQVKNRILANLSNGAIILEHCDSQQTAQILPSLIREIQARGYKIVTVPGLFE